jgi:hypothetical protein
MDKESKEKIVYGHLRLVMKLVSIFVGRASREKQELIGVAFLALVEAVDDLAIKGIVKPEEAGAYINKSVTWALRVYLCEGHLIRIPRASYHRSPNAGLRDPESIHTVNGVIPLIDAYRPVSPELKDIIDGLAETGIEKQVIILRSRGFSDTDVANQLGYTKQRIGQIRKLLYERFLTKWQV